MRPNNVLFLSFLLLVLPTWNTQGKDIVKIASNIHYVSSQWEDLLTHALTITSDEFGPYEIVFYGHALSNEKHMKEMAKGTLINARTGVNTPQRASVSYVIPIPLRKGLLNYRLLLVKQSELSKFEGIQTLADLKKLKLGLVDRWIISDILEHYKFDVMRIPKYGSLFRML